MKDFLKFTFASVIGVILAGVVFTILGIITLVGIVASSASSPLEMLSGDNPNAS